MRESEPFNPASASIGGAPPRPGPSESAAPESREGRPPWPPSAAVAGLFLALLGTFLLSAFVAVAFLAVGVDDPEDTASFQFAGIATQAVAFVAATLAVTGRVGPPRPSQFGFRRVGPSAVGWALVTLVAYFVLAAIYIQLAHPPQDDLPQQLGADKSTGLAIVTGVFVIGVAPPVEEFFFRGFVYQSLRNRIGIGGAAVVSGLIFGAIHLKPDFLVPLAILGILLALLFQKTNSLWPCILVHALNNAIAFSVSL
jgi:CAAX protease family protein